MKRRTRCQGILTKLIIKIWCFLFHDYYTYSMPSAGKFLVWDCTCNICGNEFKIKKPNTPQWRNPYKNDLRQPATWAEINYDPSKLIK